MAYPYTTLNVAYGTASSAAVPLPSGIDAPTYVAQIVKAQGFWIPGGQLQTTTQPATALWVPYAQVTGITAS